MDSSPQHIGMGFESGFLTRQVGNIGQPVYFESSLFAGHIRVELQEIQQAVLGRKYANVDRRPLDPPPAVHLRIFAVYHFGTNAQREQEVTSYQDVNSMGMLCTLDLFPVPESALHNRCAESPHAIAYMDYFMQSQSLSFFPLYPSSTGNLDHSGASQVPFPMPRRQSKISYITPESELGDVVYRLDNHLVTESSKLTSAVVGEKCVEPILMDYMDKKSLFFIFNDLAVQREGTFMFRYRVFDIFSSATYAAAEHPILAEVFGGVFKVYSTRAFPGLAPSTEFTKSLPKYGLRVTMRDSERKGIPNRPQ